MAKVLKYVQESFIDDLICPVALPEVAEAPQCVLSIGGSLKAARLKKAALKAGQKKSAPETIQDIARELCLRPQFIEALEADQFDLLPGVIYAKGFIRSYAGYLGLDADALVERFRLETGAQSQVCQLAFPEPVEKRYAPKWVVAAAILFLVSGTYGIWLGVSRDTSPAGYQAEGFDAVAAVAKAPATMVAKNQAQPVAQSGKNTDAKVNQAPAAVMPVSVTTPEASTAAPAPAPAAAAEKAPADKVIAPAGGSAANPAPAPLHPQGHSYYRQVSLGNKLFSGAGKVVDEGAGLTKNQRISFENEQVEEFNRPPYDASHDRNLGDRILSSQASVQGHHSPSAGADVSVEMVKLPLR